MASVESQHVRKSYEGQHTVIHGIDLATATVSSWSSSAPLAAVRTPCWG